jgi:putative methyltransferase (TIGR04325 family)
LLRVRREKPKGGDDQNGDYKDIIFQVPFHAGTFVAFDGLRTIAPCPEAEHKLSAPDPQRTSADCAATPGPGPSLDPYQYASLAGKRVSWHVRRIIGYLCRKEQLNHLAMSRIVDTYENYGAALAACGNVYNDLDLAEVVAFKTMHQVGDRGSAAPEEAVHPIVAVGVASAGIGNRQLTVLDFGGACGLHYVRVVATMQTPLRWAIVETPTMAARASKLLENYVRVFTAINDAMAALGPVDLVYASGSIQYVPDPLETLKALAAIRPRYLMLARFPLWREAAIVGVQTCLLSHNGIGPMPESVKDREIKYPVTFININDVLRTLDSYSIALTLESPTHYIVCGKAVPGVSIMFRAK